MIAKERPILFSGPMVKAILEGKKAMTRSVVSAKSNIHAEWPLTGLQSLSDGIANFHVQNDVDSYMTECVNCPYTQGMRLWVRETWCPANSENGPVVCYKADYHRRYLADESYPVDYGLFPAGRGAWSCWAADLESGTEGAWKPSIFMPRWASRITLEVTSVRVERLQGITPADMQAEGIDCLYDGDQINEHYTRQVWVGLWDGINAKRGYSWDSNPWVWRVEFRKVDR